MSVNMKIHKNHTQKNVVKYHSWIVLTFTYFFPTHNPNHCGYSLRYHIASFPCVFFFSRAFKLFIYSIVMITIRIRNSLIFGLGFWHRNWWNGKPFDWLSVVFLHLHPLFVFLSFGLRFDGLLIFRIKINNTGEKMLAGNE